MDTGSSELLVQQPGAAFLGPDGRHVLLLRTENPNFPEGTASVYDLRERRSWPLTTHGKEVTLMAWDPSGARIVTGSRDGIVRVGPVTGEEPHLLIGHEGPIWGVRVDPTGRLVASTSEDGTVRIWPMPEGPPLHTWSRDALARQVALADERSHRPGRLDAHGLSHDVRDRFKGGAASLRPGDVRREVGTFPRARLPPPEPIPLSTHATLGLEGAVHEWSISRVAGAPRCVLAVAIVVVFHMPPTTASGNFLLAFRLSPSEANGHQ